MKKKSLIIGLIVIAVVCILGLTTKVNAETTCVEFGNNTTLYTATRDYLHTKGVPLNWNDEENLFWVDVSEVTTLELSNKGIVDVTPLQAFTSLTKLDLSHNSIADMRPLTTLTNLTYLDLGYNKITAIPESIFNISRNLNTLYLNDNSILNIHWTDDLAPRNIKLQF